MDHVDGMARCNNLSPWQDPGHKPSGPRKRKMPSQPENIHVQNSLSARRIRLSAATDLNETPPHLRQELVGDNGMFLGRMQEADLPIPQFQCVTTEMVQAIEQLPLDAHRLTPCIPGIADELAAKTSLADIKAHINALPAANRDKRTAWLSGLSKFIASDDFYELVNDSQAAGQIKSLKMPLPPLIVRSSGVNDTWAYSSEVQGDEDVLRTCFRVMASGYRPSAALQPMALIIQHRVNCRYSGVAVSYQSFQDDTIRVEYTPGQPKGAVVELPRSDAYQIQISRGTDQPQFTPGLISHCFILAQKGNKNEVFAATEIRTPATGSEGHRLSDVLVVELGKTVIKLENLLLHPVDLEFAIDHQGRLFLLQVRPFIQLSSGVEFAMPTPGCTVATGEGVSEGYCTGTIWSAGNKGAEPLPEEAIIVARHGEPWMLKPEYLDRAAGFVFAAGGKSDPVAITLRQAGKPCLLAGKQYQAVATRHDQQATLVCARFYGTPQAFIVAGDLSAQLTQRRTASSASDAVKLPEAQAPRDDLLPPEGTFDRIDTGFRWLTEQNARLLAFFAPGMGLDCLSSPLALSMSAQRSEILAAARVSINRLVRGAEALINGYKAFFQPAVPYGGMWIYQVKFSELIQRFNALKETITSKLDTITFDLNNTRPAEFPVSFRQWITTCQELQSCLQALNPAKADEFQSVHELIFLLHRYSVVALTSVTRALDQDRLTIDKEHITCFDYTPPGEEGLLRPCDTVSVEKLRSKAVLINMADALIVHLYLEGHITVIELLENADGGKGRTLRLSFSDQFHFADGSDAPGKLKRMWLLVQLLKATGIDKNDMHVRINAVTGTMIVECIRMSSRQTMQDAFAALISLLEGTANLTNHLKKTTIFTDEHWNFSKLEYLLDSTGSTQADRFAFNECLFSIACRNTRQKPCYYRFLNSHHQQFFDHVQLIVQFTGSYQDMLTLVGDKIDQNTRREILHHLLLSKPSAATLLLEHEYNLQNEYFILKPSYSYGLQFHLHPGLYSGQPLSDSDKKSIESLVQIHDIKLASQAIRSDKDIVLLRLKENGLDLDYVSETLKRDKEVVMTAIYQSGFSLYYASPELQDNDEIVLAAINQYPKALRFAGERLRSDKSFIQSVLKINAKYIQHASLKLLNDREFMLSCIEYDSLAYTCCGSKLKDDPSFINEAIRRNRNVKEFV